MIETAARLCPPNLCDERAVDHPTPQDDAEPEPPPPPSPPEGLWALLDDAAGAYQTLVSPDPEAVSSAMRSNRRRGSSRPRRRPPPGHAGPEHRSRRRRAAGGRRPSPPPAWPGSPCSSSMRWASSSTRLSRARTRRSTTCTCSCPTPRTTSSPRVRPTTPTPRWPAASARSQGQRSTEQRGADVDRQRLVLQAMLWTGSSATCSIACRRRASPRTRSSWSWPTTAWGCNPGPPPDRRHPRT